MTEDLGIGVVAMIGVLALVGSAVAWRPETRSAKLAVALCWAGIIAAAWAVASFVPKLLH